MEGGDTMLTAVAKRLGAAAAGARDPERAAMAGWSRKIGRSADAGALRAGADADADADAV